jgi:hypothetical protein
MTTSSLPRQPDRFWWHLPKNASPRLSGWKLDDTTKACSMRFPSEASLEVITSSASQRKLHDVASSDPCGEDAPAGHRMHSPDPGLDLYLPCAHKTHCASPFTNLYLPGAQAAHAPPSGPVYPSLQEQAALPALLPAPVPQYEHSVGPVVFLYVSAGHATHAAAGPVYPTLHSQDGLPGALFE